MIELSVEGFDVLIREVLALAVPHPEAIAAMYEVGELAFEDTQEKVHVVSGRLRDSGELHAAMIGADEFYFEISYSTEYAQTEMDRGGDHDFFRDLYLYYELFEDAMATGFGTPTEV